MDQITHRFDELCSDTISSLLEHIILIFLYHVILKVGYLTYQDEIDLRTLAILILE
jgi:hypothetical protein